MQIRMESRSPGRDLDRKRRGMTDCPTVCTFPALILRPAPILHCKKDNTPSNNSRKISGPSLSVTLPAPLTHSLGAGPYNDPILDLK